MKIAVIGAGGVGGYYGSLLAAAGNEVHFLARGPHLLAMRAEGLQIRSLLGDLHIKPVQATDKAAEIGTVELALFCTKAFQTRAAAFEARPLIGSATTVLSLQNGVEAVDQLGPILGSDHVIAGATWISSFVAAPGVIRHVSESRRVIVGEIDGRVSERVGLIRETFKAAGATAEHSSNIVGVLWSKLIFISALAGIGSLLRLPISVYRSSAEARRGLVAMLEEAAAVAIASGVRLESDVVTNALAYVDSARPEIKPSMQLDVEAGRPFELDALIGVIVRTGLARDVPTPWSAAVYALLLPSLASSQ